MKSHAQLATLIKQKSNGDVKIKEALKVLRLLSEVAKEQLEKGNDVKLNNLVLLEVIETTEQKRYDGINDRYFTAPAHKKVSAKPTKTIKKIKIRNQ